MKQSLAAFIVAIGLGMLFLHAAHSYHPGGDDGGSVLGSIGGPSGG